MRCSLTRVMVYSVCSRLLGQDCALGIAAQRALQTADWAQSVPLASRTAVHTGVAERRSDNYFGPTLNRAARLVAVGWGRQLLCSQSAAGLLADDLDPNVRLIDLGEHRLADLSRPEHVFQVNYPGAGRDFPRLRSLGARTATTCPSR